MGPDQVLGHAHQTCDDGHLLFRISRKVLRSGNGLFDRGRFMAHPRWTGELGWLGCGAHRREHDRTLPDHVVFVQCSISRAGLRHERGSARSRPWVDARCVPVNSRVTDPYLRCWARCLFISNMVTRVLPNTAWSFSSAMISRLFCGSWSLCFLM